MSTEIDRDEARPVRPHPVRIDFAVCESTGVCAAVCPEDVFEHKDGHTGIVKAEACTECWICVDHCVSSAIHIG